MLKPGTGYYNVKMLLLRPFIVYATKHSERDPSLLDAVNKCTDAAAKTIELLHETYRVHFFFHTWSVSPLNQK